MAGTGFASGRDEDPAACRGAVAAAFPAAAEAGAEMLASGGNAIDAACAAAWALGVCEPAESGLGGQTTMLVRLGGVRCVVLDGHSRAPAAVTRAAVKRAQQDQGVCATTIPSTPATLGEAQRRYGRLSPARVLGPAIRLAEEGYRITALQRRLQRWTASQFERGSAEAEMFLGAGGVPHQIGELFRQPRLARALRRLASAGAEDFYRGEIARDIAADMRERGGLVTEQDLAGLAVPVEREAMEIEYGGHRVLSIPPPGGGVQVLLALRLLGALREEASDPGAWQRAVLSATLAAFRERERWPDHPDDMSPTLAGWLVSPARAEQLSRDIRAGRWAATPEDSMGEEGNTTHVCAADGEGNVVSLTQSIQSVYGAKTAHPRLGFLYNNYLSTCPRRAHPYRLGPGSLPQSNAAPTLVLRADGTPRLALGSAGSRRIVTSIVQVVSAVLDRGRSLLDAVAGPRAHALLSGKVWAEAGVEAGLRGWRPPGGARADVHVLSDHNYKLGAVQALAWDEAGRIEGAADPRRDGAVVKCRRGASTGPGGASS